MSPLEVLYVVALWALLLVPPAITARKGHLAFFLAGFVTIGLTWFVGAVRLAQPNSPWARHRYDEEKMRRSRERYPATDPSTNSPAPIAMYLVFGTLAMAFVGGFLSAQI